MSKSIKMTKTATCLQLTALVCAVSALPAVAQSNGSAAQKSIEQSLQALRDRTPKPLAHVDMLGLEVEVQIDKLAGVDSPGDLLGREIQNYWRPFVGGAVSTQDVQQFLAWFYETARQAGSLAYARVQVQATAQGHRMNGKVTFDVK